MLLLLVLFSSFQLAAQNLKADSTIIKTKIAIADARYFKISKQAWKAYKKHQFIYSSDYFRPTAINTDHVELLTDSIYVKAFKKAAYQKTSKRRTVGHYVLAGYMIGTVSYAIILVIELATGSLKI